MNDSTISLVRKNHWKSWAAEALKIWTPKLSCMWPKNVPILACRASFEPTFVVSFFMNSALPHKPSKSCHLPSSGARRDEFSFSKMYHANIITDFYGETEQLHVAAPRKSNYKPVNRKTIRLQIYWKIGKLTDYE